MRKPIAIQKCYGGMDRWMDGQTDGWTDMASCRVECPRLKMKVQRL